MVDAPVRGQIGVGVGGQRDQSLQVVADDFGGNILGDGLLGQSCDVFQIEAMLESFECFLDTPALVVKLAEVLSTYGSQQNFVK